MLRGVSLHLASQVYTVSVIARRRQRLYNLAQEAHLLAGHINPIQVDYQNGALLRVKIEEAVNTFGPVILAVCWIHSIAPQAPYIVAESIGRGPAVGRYFDVRGSAAADPSHPEPQREVGFQQFTYILYRRIILGFVLRNGGSRWLTNDEISTGVLQAIERDAALYVVGTVQPWSARP